MPNLGINWHIEEMIIRRRIIGRMQASRNVFVLTFFNSGFSHNAGKLRQKKKH